jgi:ribosome-associated protein
MALVRAGPEVAHDYSDALLALDLYGTSPAFGIDGPEGGPLKLATTGQLVLPSLDRAVICARVAADNKGRDIVVLDMRGITPLYDFFVLATGTSRRLVHTITEEVDAALLAQGDRRISIEGYEASTWVVQDYGDVVVHVFNTQTREYYGVEELWADAPRIDWENHDIAEE